MLYFFLLIFPLGLKKFLIAYLSSISPRFYPTTIFGGLILFIDLKDGFDQGEYYKYLYMDDLIPNRLRALFGEPAP